MTIMRCSVLPSLGFALLLGAIYGRAILQNDFVTWDDGLLITGNPIVRELSLGTVKKAFTTYDPELYIPLTFLSYQMDHLVWGLNPVGFHLTNLVLHILNTILVYMLTVLLFRSCHSERSRGTTRLNEHSSPGFDYAQPDTYTMIHSWIPLFIALLFAIHPLNTEAVAWASARKDLLSGFFFLLTLCTYLRWTEVKRRKGWYVLSVISDALGLLAKVSIVPLPMILLLIDWLQQRRLDRRTILEKGPFCALSLIFGIIAMFGKTGNTELLSEKILMGAKTTLFYLEKLLWPTGLSVLYPYTQSITWSNSDLFIPLVFVLTVSALAFFLRKNYPMVSFGWAFFLLMLLPSFTNFAKGHDELRDVYFASDRYAYLPSIGIFLLFGTTLLSFLPSPSLITSFLLTCFFLLPLSVLSYRQSHVWHDTETLFRNVAEQYPTSHIAWNNLGSIALEQGNTKTAMEDYERSLTIRPNNAAFFNLGQIALKKGLVREAMELYRRAIASRPNDTDSLLNLGVLHLRNGNTVAAADLFRRAIAFDDHLAIAHFNLGLALEAIRDHDGARSAFAHALELDPSDQEAREKLARLATPK